MAEEDSSSEVKEATSKKKNKRFFDSTLGRLALGFVFTTGAGALLNHVIQTEMHKNTAVHDCVSRVITHRYDLQKELLELAQKRYHRSGMVKNKLSSVAFQGEPSAYSNNAKKYWLANLTDIKDVWNEKVTIYHSSVKTLFGEDLADKVIEKQQDLHGKYYYQAKEKPTNLQQAFEYAHETLYYLVFRCNAHPGGCELAGTPVQGVMGGNADQSMLYPSWESAYARLNQEMIDLNGQIVGVSEEMVSRIYADHASCQQLYKSRGLFSWL